MLNFVETDAKASVPPIASQMALSCKEARKGDRVPSASQGNKKVFRCRRGRR